MYTKQVFGPTIRIKFIRESSGVSQQLEYGPSLDSKTAPKFFGLTSTEHSSDFSNSCLVVLCRSERALNTRNAKKIFFVMGNVHNGIIYL